MERTKNAVSTIVYFKMIFILLLFISITGCGQSEKDSSVVLLPEFGNILPSETENNDGDKEDEPESILPVKLFMDNTGSMTGYTINKYGYSQKPCSEFVKLMSSIRDMGMMQKTKYYVLDAETYEWKRYKKSLYNNFSKSNFYIYWPKASKQSGPLTKLYMEELLDSDYINIVMTDLSEQNLNNTALAEQIQKMCTEGGCEADLYAFKFVFNGKTQVPSPDSLSEMLSKNIVNKRKPYYMIITGPKNAMAQYRKGFRESLKNYGLKVGKDYYTVTSRVKLNQEQVVLSDIQFKKPADYDAIDAEHKVKERAVAEKEITSENESDTDNEIQKENETVWIEEEQKTVNMDALTKNLEEVEDTASLFEKDPKTDMCAFRYSKVEGISKEEFDWRLLFQVPLKGDQESLEYSYDYQIYTLSEKESEERSKEEAEEKAEAEPIQEWVENDHCGIQVAGSINDSSKAYCFSVSGGGNKTDATEKAALIKLKIVKKETYTYKQPKWLAKFDTGNTNNYYTRTFNLMGFYNVLFCDGRGFGVGEQREVTSTYIQIPILLTELDG